MFKRFEISPDKISNIYALLGAFLVISEGLLGFWFSKSSDSAERIVAGSLMTVILVGFMVLVYKIKIVSPGPVPVINDQKVTTASEEVSAEQVKSVAAEQLAGPAGTYTIDMPPSNWKVKQVDMTGLMLDNYELPNSAVPESNNNIPDEQKNILLLQSNITYEIFPIPGKTTINGRILPTALGSPIKIKLAIIPIERLQPPFYTESSFTHNAYTLMGQMLQSGLLSLEKTISGEIEHSKREFIQMDMVQRLEHVDLAVGDQILNDCTGVQNSVSILGIKGDIIDHILLLSYPIWPGNPLDQSFNQELSVLKNLVKSFRPLKVSNPVDRLNAIKERANISFKTVLSQVEETSFLTEMVFGLRRVSALNSKNPSDQKRIIRTLRPFRQLYKEIKMQDDQLDELWAELDEAEKGNIEPLMEIIAEILEDIDEEIANNGVDTIDNAAQPKALDNG